jgi:Gram-negative bacterial TonB protein C-terminal
LSSFFYFRPHIHVVLPTVLILITAVFAVGQSTGSSEAAPETNPVLRRIARARALAAVHQLQAAATELENIRASVNDVTLRNAATLMLLGIYLEEGNYGRSQSLLEETFQTRAAQKDESLRTYFAAAGQTINGIRAHLARYRTYGINPGDADLPVEANSDLERVRSLLERVIAQAQEISKEAGRSYNALVLQEDVLGIRLSLARNNDDRAKWQAEYMAAREKMASSQLQVASLGRSPALDAVTNRIPNPFITKPAAPAANSDATPIQTPVVPTPAVASAPEPQLVSTGALVGRETKRVTPVYPSQARTNNVSGNVRVFAIVDENGKIWVTNSEGPMLLRQAAEDAAKGWTFPPSNVNGKPVRLAGYLDFDFKL